MSKTKRKTNQTNNLTNQFFKDLLAAKQGESTIDTENTIMLNCENPKCRKVMICSQEFKSEIYTCPHCGKKNKVRSYKNGKITSSLVK